MYNIEDLELYIPGQVIRDRLDYYNGIISDEQAKSDADPSYKIGSDDPEKYRRAQNTLNELNDLNLLIDPKTDKLAINYVYNKLDYYNRELAYFYIDGVIDRARELQGIDTKSAEKKIEDKKSKINPRKSKISEIEPLTNESENSSDHDEQTKNKGENKSEEQPTKNSSKTESKEMMNPLIARYQDDIFEALTNKQKEELVWNAYEKVYGKKPGKHFKKFRKFWYLGDYQLTDQVKHDIAVGNILIKDLDKNKRKVKAIQKKLDIDFKGLEKQQLLGVNASNKSQEESQNTDESNSLDKNKTKENTRKVNDTNKVKQRPYREVLIEKLDDKTVEILNNPNKLKELHIDFLEGNPTITLGSTADINSEALEKLSSKYMIRILDGITDELSDNKFSQKLALRYDKKELQSCIKELEKIENGINPNWSDAQKVAYFYKYLSTHIKCADEIDLKEDKTNRIMSDMKYRSLASIKQGKATYEGFSILMKELCDRNNIDCEYCFGGFDNNTGRNRSWNIVTLDGKKYPIDVFNGSNFYFGSKEMENPALYNQFSNYYCMCSTFKDIDGKDTYFGDYHIPNPTCKTQDYTKLSSLSQDGISALMESLGHDERFEIKDLDENNESYPKERFVQTRNSDGQIISIKLDYPFRMKIGNKLIYQSRLSNNDKTPVFLDGTDEKNNRRNIYDVLEPSPDIEIGDQIAMNDDAEDYFASISKFNPAKDHRTIASHLTQKYVLDNGRFTNVKYIGKSKKDIDRPYQYELSTIRKVKSADGEKTGIIVRSTTRLHTNTSLFQDPERHLTKGELIKYTVPQEDIDLSEIHKDEFDEYKKSVNFIKTERENRTKDKTQSEDEDKSNSERNK